eukprot:CAMPEP_0175098334 /NCGR_PEP_ID=MMETSP0086_2-20121207/5804_1 /TAXON_ID=136419 /ORGANISM="Unknown Unknown, Strain D1" /LENGTH=150 /DNA_ID=CAMNT_0016371983 /DNA_START=364 /DNA_END=814 /DNA_ORIENTATION=-
MNLAQRRSEVQIRAAHATSQVTTSDLQLAGASEVGVSGDQVLGERVMGVVGEVGGLEALSGGTAAATKRFWAACTANSFVPAGEKANEDKPKLGSCDPPPTKLKGCIAVAPEAEKKTWTREVAKSDTNSSSSCVELWHMPPPPPPRAQTE